MAPAHFDLRAGLEPFASLQQWEFLRPINLGDECHQPQRAGEPKLWEHRSTSMQVFTTIYLAETLRANIECVEETEGLDQQQPGVLEFKHTLRKRIAMLENQVFYEDGDVDD